MPYMVSMHEGKHCVYKKGEDGKPMGKTLGCHDSEEGAKRQMAAVHASEGKPAKKELSLDKLASLVRGAWYDQWRAAHPQDPNGPYMSTPWVQEVYPDYLIVQDESKDQHLKVSWGKDAEGEISFGEPQAVTMVWLPAEGSKATIFKDADGAWRWFGWVSNWYRDNDSPKEIISGKAHRAYVQAAEKAGQLPELWLWHVPGSRVGQADLLTFSDGFLMASGTFDKGMEDVAEKLSNDGDLTMSHGFMRLKHDAKEVVTDQYWMLECSGLPSSAEANPWTNLSALKEVTMPLPKAKRDFLVAKLGEDRVKAIEENTTALKTAAEAAGVDWKEVERLESEVMPAQAPPAAAPVTAPAQAPASASATIETSQIVEAVAAQLVERLQLKDLSTFLTDIKARLDGITALSGQVSALEAEVKALKATDDEKVAKALTPKGLEIPPFVWMQKAASQSPATKLDEAKPEDAALKAAGPSAMDRLLGGIFGAQGLP